MRSTKRQLARNSFREVSRLSNVELKEMSKAELLVTINGYKLNNDDFRAKIQELILFRNRQSKKSSLSRSQS